MRFESKKGKIGKKGKIDKKEKIVDFLTIDKKSDFFKIKK